MRLPSTTALRAFETAARQLNFTAAARDLHLTQGAVSHQIRELESLLGVTLFDRKGRGLALSASGRAYLPFVREALERLRAGGDAVGAKGRATVLTVSLSPNFATKWLVPRLGSFVAGHPDLDLRISASLQHIDFAQDDIDMAVRHGEGVWPHLDVVRLCSEVLFPVCSPSLLRDGPGLACVRDLSRHVLLHDQDRNGWQTWLRQVGASELAVSGGPVFNQTSLAIDAAVAGQGVALARSALASLDLQAGRLVRPLDDAVPAKFAYWIVCPKATAASPKIARFRDWLLDQAAEDATALGGDRPDD